MAPLYIKLEKALLNFKSNTLLLLLLLLLKEAKTKLVPHSKDKYFSYERALSESDTGVYPMVFLTQEAIRLLTGRRKRWHIGKGEMFFAPAMPR